MNYAQIINFTIFIVFTLGYFLTDFKGIRTAHKIFKNYFSLIEEFKFQKLIIGIMIFSLWISKMFYITFAQFGAATKPVEIAADKLSFLYIYIPIGFSLTIVAGILVSYCIVALEYLLLDLLIQLIKKYKK
ncbi:hypothetical protein [Ligilactobacillus salivarius]|uniref:Uncharacterized protein n=1 Tax=Ligilactobacillus salivarius TaxID=1624 RepID=A0A1V9RBR9_9LACO|nr:hypothetical protein [Ligilactobacillus salivarius]OQQ90524.1 hypothetical protein B6U56_04360 [Ligilactobacillus salivarius]